ncbi:MAG: 50S ribosomal protein L29 [Gemmatimonadota bacterium]|jgi:large subunit ribosomal protein L29
MTPEEIRALGPEELSDRILEMEDELFRLRIQNEMGQLDNPILVRDMKRTLARCKTIRREYELKGER